MSYNPRIIKSVVSMLDNMTAEELAQVNELMGQTAPKPEAKPQTTSMFVDIYTGKDGEKTLYVGKKGFGKWPAIIKENMTWAFRAKKYRAKVSDLTEEVKTYLRTLPIRKNG